MSIKGNKDMNRELERIIDYIPKLVDLSRFESAETRRLLVDRMLKAIYQINKDLESGALVSKQVGNQLPTNEMKNYQTILDKYSKADNEAFTNHLNEQLDKVRHDLRKHKAVRELDEKKQRNKQQRHYRF